MAAIGNAKISSPCRQCDQGVSAGHAQWLKVFEIAGQQQQASVLGHRRYRDIGKTGVAALCSGSIRNLPRKPRGARIQRQDAVCVGGQQAVEPAVKAISPVHATRAAQLANALRHFSNGNGGQKKLLVMCLQPLNQGGGHKGVAPRCQC